MTHLAEGPLDIHHLDRYTGGDRGLNEEVLRLFETECREILQRLEGLTRDWPPDAAESWRQTTHTLKGASRGVGAFELAEMAARAEETEISDRLAALAAVRQIACASQAVLRFIEEFFKNGA